jgi:acetyl-CoA/propionyl-CoA carboxylase carboxyl transferase subunit
MSVSIAERALQDRPAAARDPLARLAGLLDPGSLSLLHLYDDVAVSAGQGMVDGIPVIGFATDATRKGGALGLAECERIEDAINLAADNHVPVIGLWHSAGAKLQDGIMSMHGIARIFRATVRASGRIPQISVILGPAAGGAAYGPALTDCVIMAPEGRMFVTGPDVVRSVTGEDIDMETLGGADAHGGKSGVSHMTAKSQADACAKARRLVTLLARPGWFDIAATGPGDDPRRLLPASPRRAYDVRPLIRVLLDEAGNDGFLELQPQWARNVVIGLGRLGGGTVGVIASNPLHKAGCLDSLSAEKSARFVRMCDAAGIPLLVLVDVPGFLPGVAQEWGGVVRRGAKLLYAFAEAEVTRVTLITRKSYGGAYIAMNSFGLGATSVFAWPEAEVDVMGAESAVRVLYKREIMAAPEKERNQLCARLAEQHREMTRDLSRSAEPGLISAVIEPVETRRRLIAVFASAQSATAGSRRQHGNIPL